MHSIATGSGAAADVSSSFFGNVNSQVLQFSFEASVGALSCSPKYESEAFDLCPSRLHQYVRSCTRPQHSRVATTQWDSLKVSTVRSQEFSTRHPVPYHLFVHMYSAPHWG